MIQIHQGISVFILTLIGHIRNVDSAGCQSSCNLSNHVRNIFMKHADSAYCFLHAHIAGREIDRISDISVLQILHQLLHCHLGTVILRLLCRCAQMRNHNGIFHVGRLGIGEVCYILLYLSRL